MTLTFEVDNKDLVPAIARNLSALFHLLEIDKSVYSLPAILLCRHIKENQQTDISTNEKIGKICYPGQAASTPKVSRTISYLKDLLIYLAYLEQLEQESAVQHLLKMKAFEDAGRRKKFGLKITVVEDEQILDDRKNGIYKYLIDNFHYYSEYRYVYLTDQSKNIQSTALSQLHSSLDHYYFSQKLKLYIGQMANEALVGKYLNERPAINLLLNYLGTFDEKEMDSTLFCFYNLAFLYSSLENNSSKEKYQKELERKFLKAAIAFCSDPRSFELEDQQFIYTALQNYCGQQRIRGYKIYIKYLSYIVLNALYKGVLYKKKKLGIERFINISSVIFINKEKNANAIIESQISKLSKKDRPVGIAIAKITDLYYQKNYQACYSEISKFKPKDPFVRLVNYSFEARCIYYFLKHKKRNDIAFINATDKIKTNIRNIRPIADGLRNAFLNLIIWIDEYITQNIMNQKFPDEWRKLILENPAIANKEWLLEEFDRTNSK